MLLSLILNEIRITRPLLLEVCVPHDIAQTHILIRFIYENARGSFYIASFFIIYYKL